jgi:hypothetical protein
MRISLDTLTNLVLITTCVAVTTVVIERYRSPGADARVAYTIGEKMGSASTINYASAERTLVMFLRDGCHFCTESMPFYRQLARDRASNEPFRIVVATPNDVGVARSYLANNAFAVDDIQQIRPGALKVSGTPTLILVDRTGIVHGYWRGKLSPAAEREVRQRLGLS